MDLSIDLNADVGERPEALSDGTEEALIQMISSANIACGAHAGDERTMEGVIKLCLKYGVAIGAHPGYPDRANFGRIEMPLPASEIEACIYEQVRTLSKKASARGAELKYVKPHGALYNVAARERRVAEAIGRGVAQCSRDLVLVGLAGSIMLKVWEEMGFRAVGEAFADRVYEADGTLRSRSKGGALITDTESACAQAVKIVKDRMVISGEGSAVALHAATICVHSDTPNAREIISLLRRRLDDEGIVVRSFVR